MGNNIKAVCSCNQNQDNEDVNFFQKNKENEKVAQKLSESPIKGSLKVKSNKQEIKEASKFNKANDFILSDKDNYHKLIKLQRYVKTFISIKTYLKNENKGNERQDSYSNTSNVVKKSGFDDKNYKYSGEYENGFKQGFGIQTWRDGAIYKGYFYENKANFLGVFTHSDNDVYMGEFKDDRAFGYGLYKHANGANYEGLWIDDTQHGYGVEIWTDGSEYKGEYFKGKKLGYGVYNWADGSSYEGEWFDNTLHGYVS